MFVWRVPCPILFVNSSKKVFLLSMRKLSLFSIRSFVGPFVVTFAISMFILIMQFFWKYIDDLMGKGIETIYILELLFYVSASLIPLALPLAMLLSSIMTLGNLSENNELTALKSSGLSLYKILKPLTFIVVVIALATFLFANYIIPMANYKWHSLIYDFQNTKLASIIVPGVYTKEIDGYAIKVLHVNPDESLQEITIHDRTSPEMLKVIKAQKGSIYRSDNGKHLFFHLENGTMAEELNIISPVFDQHGIAHDNNNLRPSRRSSFEQATYKIDLSGFAMNRSEAEMFKDEYEMLTVFQLHDALDSVNKKIDTTLYDFSTAIKQTHEFFQSITHKNILDSLTTNYKQESVAPIHFSALSNEEQRVILRKAIEKMEHRQNTLAAQKEYLSMLDKGVNKYWIEFHRKFALTYAIAVLFFVGAPLGAIVRKGGFGAPVVLAALLFMFYFVLNSIGESLVESETVRPFWGMWFASIILTPIAWILLHSAANDAPIFERETWKSLITLRRS